MARQRHAFNTHLHYLKLSFIGGVGLGKSHLAIALGLAACHQQHSVLFASAIDAVNTLAAAQATGRLKQELRRYVRPRLLILDELGYLPTIAVAAQPLERERGPSDVATRAFELAYRSPARQATDAFESRSRHGSQCNRQARGSHSA